MQIQPILGYFWAIFGLHQPPGPPFLHILDPALCASGSVHCWLQTNIARLKKPSPIFAPSLKMHIYIMVNMQMEHFCPKHMTKMSIFYQLNMFKILRYFTEYSTRH